MAADIVIDSILDGDLEELSNNGKCELREAMLASQSNAAVDACVSGGMDDLILITGLSGTLTLTSYMFFETSLGSLKIVGPGPDQLMIDLDQNHIFFGQTDLYISGIAFSNGHATSGGAFYLSLTDAVIENVRVINNSALYGGAIRVWHGTLELKNSELSGNEAGHGGGIIGNSATIVVTNSSIGENLAGSEGGAIDMTQGALSILNSTISNNHNISGNSGGAGIYIDPLNVDFVLEIRNSIIANNYYDDFDTGEIIGRGDIDSYPLGHPNRTIIGSIDHSIIDVSMLPVLPTLAITNSLTNAQVDLTDLDLGDLGFSGGSTQTFGLGASSVALDFGDPAFSGLDCDQRGLGFPRIIGKRVDAGSFESRQDIIVHDGFENDGMGIVCSE